MKTFGTLISDARRAKGLSQKDLAAKVKKEDGKGETKPDDGKKSG